MPPAYLVDRKLGPLRYTRDTFWHTLHVGRKYKRHWSVSVQRFFDRSGWEVRLNHNAYNGLYVELKIEREGFLNRRRRKKEDGGNENR